jgi:hypothetical protein
LCAGNDVAHLLAKEIKPFSNGVLVRKCWQLIVQEIFLVKESALILFVLHNNDVMV